MTTYIFCNPKDLFFLVYFVSIGKPGFSDPWSFLSLIIAQKRGNDRHLKQKIRNRYKANTTNYIQK
ncbi:hypothetical protein B1H10_00330 [candidate division KSB1 bacterium 4484_188]|nr:MAG: hypothetical protein B1H10_00330 [candidate division KSB1 bacterium 4484_188]